MHPFRFLGRRILLVVVSILLAVCLVHGTATAQQVNDTIAKTPRPSWTSDISIPLPKDERMSQVSGGLYYLLVSSQIRQTDGEIEHYVRTAIQVINRSGLEEAAVVVASFRPDMDTIQFHLIRVHRGDEVIDLLESSHFDILRREQDLEKGVLDGRYTAFVNLPDIRVGDVIEYAYSVRYRPTLAEQGLFANFQHEFDVPVGLIESRVVYPPSLDVSVNASPGIAEPEIEMRDGEVAATWRSYDPEPHNWEDNAPYWSQVYRRVDVSSAQSWGEVAHGSLPFYAPVEQLPAAFEQKVDAIAEATQDPRLRISRALALVQSDIRYVGIEIGRGAFVPRPPDIVVARGYGDCKDKAYLLTAALQRLGITAFPALASVELNKQLRERLPSPYAFDHVIVKAMADGFTYWLDPTWTHQRSPDPRQSAPNLGFALPIATDTTDLEEIAPFVPSAALTRVVEEFALNYSDVPPALSLEVRSTLKGPDADNFRNELSTRGSANIAESYLDYYKEKYDGMVSAGEIEISDNEETDVIEVVEHYEVPSLEHRDALYQDLPISADTLRNVLVTVAKGDRQNPIRLAFPFYKKHRIILRNLGGDIALLDPPEHIYTPYLIYSLDSQAEGEDLVIDWSLETRRDHVQPEEAAAYLDYQKRIEASLDWIYHASNAGPEAAFDEGAAQSHVPYLISLLVACLVMIAGLIWGLNADASYRNTGTYFPVALPKVFWMCIASLTLYPVFWMWKHWRWSKNNVNRRRIPVLRALFWPFFIYSGSMELNKLLPERAQISKFTAITAGVAGVFPWIIYVGSAMVLDGPLTLPAILAIQSVDFALTFAAIWPMARAVTVLNQPATPALLRNSRINFFNIAALLLGPLVLALAMLEYPLA